MSGGAGRLDGKVAVVTGAAAGIGRATAVRFAAEGARLVVNDLDAAGLDRLAEQVNGEFGAEVHAVVGDVSRAADARRMVDLAVTTYGGLDVLVANAGIIPLGTLADSTPDDWDHVMSVDGRGMFLTCKYAVDRDARDRPRRVGGLPQLHLRDGGAEGPGDVRPGEVRRHRPHQAPRRRARRARHPAVPSRWPPRSSSWPATTHRSSPARCSRSTEASSPSSPAAGQERIAIPTTSAASTE